MKSWTGVAIVLGLLWCSIGTGAPAVAEDGGPIAEIAKCKAFFSFAQGLLKGEADQGFVVARNMIAKFDASFDLAYAVGEDLQSKTRIRPETTKLMFVEALAAIEQVYSRDYQFNSASVADPFAAKLRFIANYMHGVHQALRHAVISCAICCLAKSSPPG